MLYLPANLFGEPASEVEEFDLHASPSSSSIFRLLFLPHSKPFDNVQRFEHFCAQAFLLFRPSGCMSVLGAFSSFSRFFPVGLSNLSELTVG
jgi:hypothetical protein